MPWIKTVPPEETTGALKKILDTWLDPAKYIGGPDELTSLKPLYTSLHYQLREEMRSPDWKLSRAQREMVAVVTSALCRCHS